VKDFFRRVKRILEYIPVLWDNWDCDYDYILDLLQYKLKRTEKCLRERDRYFGVEEDCVKIQQVIDSIEKFKNPETFKNITFEQITAMTQQELRDKNQEEYDEEMKSWDDIWNTIKAEGRRWCD